MDTSVLRFVGGAVALVGASLMLIASGALALLALRSWRSGEVESPSPDFLDPWIRPLRSFGIPNSFATDGR